MNQKPLLIICLLTAMLLAAAAAGCVKTVTTTKNPETPLTTSATQGGQTQTPLTTSNTTQGAATSPAGITTSTKPVTTASTTKPATTAKTTASTSAGGFPDIVSFKELASYRYSIMTRIEEGSGAGGMDYIKYEWVKAQKAEHAWREDADGNITETYITIGDKEWIYMPMFGWILQDARPTTTSMSNDELQKILKDPGTYKAKFTKVGSEEVNGVKCLHYEFEYTIKTTIPGVTGTTTIDAHSVGEMWIADQAGLPKVVILSKSTTDMTVRNEKTVVYNEQSLTDIGEPISIEPPDEVFTPPTGMP